MAISFSYADRKLNIAGKRKIKQLLLDVARLEGQIIGHLNYVYCSDDFLLDINRRFLQHDYYTDIVTFDLANPGQSVIDGEIYISVDRVHENAASLMVPFQEELLRVILHGLLHLLGYDDKSAAKKKIMRNAEDKYIELFKGHA
jgi:probable rRNA maturation factor